MLMQGDSSHIADKQIHRWEGEGGAPNGIALSGAAPDAAADVTLEEELALGLRQAAPNPVGLTDFEGVRTAFLDHRALPAHFLGALLALQARATALAVGVEKHR